MDRAFASEVKGCGFKSRHRHYNSYWRPNLYFFLPIVPSDSILNLSKNKKRPVDLSWPEKLLYSDDTAKLINYSCKSAPSPLSYGDFTTIDRKSTRLNSS